MNRITQNMEQLKEQKMQSDCTYCAHLAAGMAATEVGAKAANLGKALSLGLRVPPAFVVTRGALALFLEETGLIARVRKLLERCDALDHTARKQLFDELCADVGSAPIPAAIKKEVSAQAEELLKSAPAGLAVRSSGICEDTEKASFAGVYESFLCLSSTETIWNGIRRCWCSSWTPSAIDYARKMGIVPKPNQMAVIVQEVIPADSAGVLFTAEPLTGNPWRFVLNSTFGLAQNLVGGRAPADGFELEWDTGQVTEKRIVEKSRISVAGMSGVRQIDVPDDKKEKASLTDETAGQLAQLGLELDRAFERRVEIEWALADNDIHIVQVRPLTALPEFFPHEFSGSDADITWRRDGVEPVEPFTRDIKGSEQWARYREPAIGFVENRELDFNGYRYTTEYSWTPSSLGSDEFEKWMDANEGRLKHAWLTAKQEMRESWPRALEAKAAGRSASDIIPALLDMRERQADLQAMILGPPALMYVACEALLKDFIKKMAPGFDMNSLLQGLPTFSYERTKAAQDLGRSIDEDTVKAAFKEQPLAAVIPMLLEHHSECRFLREYERFCHQFASVPPSWLSRPARWAQAMVLERSQELLIIRESFLGRSRDVRKVRDESVRRREKAEEEIRLLVRQKDPSLFARFNKILDWAQFWAPLLDDRRWSHLPYYTLLELIWETGVRLQEEGLIDEPEELMLFLPEDLERIAKSRTVRDYRSLYVTRKREYEHARRLSAPEYLGTLPSPPQDAGVARDKPVRADGRISIQQKVLRGQGVTPGQVSGISRRVADLNDSALLNSLNSEHILICLEGSFGNQVDWLGILMLVKGLVTMDGYPCHHATQIARECGVIFINLPDAHRTSIPDNARVSLDGVTGTVTVRHN